MASGTLASRILGMVNASLQTAVLGTLVVGDAFKIGQHVAELHPRAAVRRHPERGAHSADHQGDEASTTAYGSSSTGWSTAAFVLIVAITVLVTAGAGVLMGLHLADRGQPATGHRVRLSLPTPSALRGLRRPRQHPQRVRQVRGLRLGTGRQQRGRHPGLVVFLVLWGQQPYAYTWTPTMIWVLAAARLLGCGRSAILIRHCTRPVSAGVSGGACAATVSANSSASPASPSWPC